MKEKNNTLIDECERLVAELEGEILGADAFDLFYIVKRGLEADVQPKDIVDQVTNYYYFGERPSWEEQ